MTREEHLEWARQRALEYVEAGDTNLALASLASDLQKHPLTAGHPLPMQLMRLAMQGELDPAGLRARLEAMA